MLLSVSQEQYPDWLVKNKSVYIKLTVHVSGILFIRYTQSRKIGKPNILKIKHGQGIPIC